MRSRHIHRHRLFAIDVFARGHDCFKMMGMEVGRRSNQDEVHFLRRGDILVGIRTLEKLGSVDGRVALRLLEAIEMLPPLIQLVGKEIGDGGHPRTRILHEA